MRFGFTGLELGVLLRVFFAEASPRSGWVEGSVAASATNGGTRRNLLWFRISRCRLYLGKRGLRRTLLQITRLVPVAVGIAATWTFVRVGVVGVARFAGILDVNGANLLYASGIRFSLLKGKGAAAADSRRRHVLTLLSSWAKQEMARHTFAHLRLRVVVEMGVPWALDPRASYRNRPDAFAVWA